MNSAGSSWFPRFSFTWGSTKEKGRDLRQQIHAISQSNVLDEANIDDAQILTLTREDLNELFPGIGNFQLRRTIMMLITEAVKDSLQPGPETFGRALKHLMQNNKSSDAAAHDVLKESLRAFQEVENQLKAAQAVLKPYIEVLNSLIEVSARKEDKDAEGSPSRRKLPNSFQTDMHSPTMPTPPEPKVRVHLLVCGRTLEAHKQIFGQLRGVQESHMSDCQLILAFCPVVSRAGTDIEEALRKIPANKPAVLVTMHHTFNANFPCPSFNPASSQGNLVEHVNVLFHDTHNGVFSCPTNDEAFNKLQSVINRYKFFPQTVNR
ncbi:uncharacterized protein si:ch211-245h14.1 isoform X2 [Labeo rohita]|uniref:uncharacterized protein si:ch211-245h14.1 isoform X2 n=1 Tax=Labeo rohita TaxID=84645 RepID=UPI0021E21176|nr:uncharacterized protein si:ch211-245h14.1 isoform X2 [Labeo rohita]